MFEKCIRCNRMGESCVPNLMLLSFHDLMQWCVKRQNHLDWTNLTLAERSKVPVGTINRIKAGDYEDCKYSTIRNLLLALIGGTTDEFACTEQVERELQQVELLEHQTAELAKVREKYEALKDRMIHTDEQHRQDIRVIREEYLEQIAFLKEQLRAWQTRP